MGCSAASHYLGPLDLAEPSFHREDTTWRRKRELEGSWQLEIPACPEGRRGWHAGNSMLLYLLQQETSSTELRTECAVVLGSLAMGTENNVKSLLDCHIIPALLQGLLSPELKFIEACLRCLRTIFTSPVTPEELLYTDATVIPHLMALLSRSRYTQEYICQIFSHCCKLRHWHSCGFKSSPQPLLCANGPDHQTILFNHGAVQNIAHLLSSTSYKVRMQALKCFSVLAFENPQVSMTLVNVLVDGELLPQIFVKMLQRDKPIEMQLTSAKCLTYMCRAGAIQTDDNCIVLKTLPSLVRMCSKERLLEERVEGAETLAYLIETDVELQRIASITDHLIAMLSDYFKYPSSVSAITDIKRLDHDLKHAHELRQAAFKLYASLGANDEDIRKKIIETENMMDRIVNGLSESSIKVRLSAVRCLHSLSRSVQQLRTSFQDHAVWKPLMKVLQNAPDEVLVVASSTLCNLLLEFSPSKEPILESGAIELLCSLTQSENLALRVNGIWALMNMAFQAEQKIKADILQGLSTEQLFQLLSDSDVNVLMKTLGLLRNLLSTRPHIDQIMSTHGKQIMQAVTLILEGEHNIEVKEQTLCILANIADGTTAKELIMTNDDILQKIKYYMKGKPIMAANHKRDPVWEYFNEVPLPVGKTGMRAKCKQCNKEMQGLVTQMKQQHEKCSFSGGSCVEDDERNMSEHAGPLGESILKIQDSENYPPSRSSSFFYSFRVICQ
ncbi:armadillo repeat-containing protein 8 isoform X6 [Lepidochelys kempii]|uniref:armadillo repeat-containing protein 8 isoform X6 n=1 Tax=Lepidochelys kempii TaxID=8472 RepID=UPI003C705411